MSEPVHPTACDLSREDLKSLLEKNGLPAYRARQVYRNVYVGLKTAYGEMTDLPQALRTKLEEDLPIGSLRLETTVQGDRGMTRKALFRTPDGNPAETVLMIYPDRATVCVSTQSGCGLACSFCATGRLGLLANLSAGHMIEQVLWAARELAAAVTGARLTNVVYMGMGEPFNNYDAWWESVVRLHDPEGFNLGARGFTVSTAGVVPGIRRLAGEDLPINLAISLHAPDDELRNRLVPLNRKFPIADILEATRDYTERTRRRVSFEYVLLQGVNDSGEQAERLARLLRGRLCHVNLIPWNPVPGTPLTSSERKRVLAFQKALENGRIPCTVRVQRGLDIAAACGQLAGAAAG